MEEIQSDRSEWRRTICAVYLFPLGFKEAAHMFKERYLKDDGSRDPCDGYGSCFSANQILRGNDIGGREQTCEGRDFRSSVLASAEDFLAQINRKEKTKIWMMCGELIPGIGLDCTSGAAGRRTATYSERFLRGWGLLTPVIIDFVQWLHVSAMRFSVERALGHMYTLSCWNHRHASVLKLVIRYVCPSERPVLCI